MKVRQKLPIRILFRENGILAQLLKPETSLTYKIWSEIKDYRIVRDKEGNEYLAHYTHRTHALFPKRK